MKMYVYFLIFPIFVFCVEDPQGHLKPLGSHQPPESPITVLYSIPSPKDFFDTYVKTGKPVLFKEAAKSMPPYKLWTDEYLSERFGNITVDVEEGKKENRSLGTFSFKLQDFINRYKKEDVYMVESLPKEMQEEYMLLRSLHCGGFTDVLQDAVMWFSSGGTKSLLHFDAVENINCLFSGSKKFIMIDKKHKPQAHIDRLDGSFSSVDVEKVDMYKFPGLRNIPWYNISMEEGDCMYIPYMWIHHVHSYGSRNLAINIWWAHFTFFNETDCKEGKYKENNPLPLSEITFKPLETQRQQVLEAMGREPVSQEQWLQIFKEIAGRYQLEPTPNNKTIQNFKELDINGDHMVSAEEIFQVQTQDILRLLSPGTRSDDNDDDTNGDEEGDNLDNSSKNKVKQEL